MSQFSDLESLVGLITAVDSGKMDNIYDSVAQIFAGIGTARTADAIQQIRDSGDDPDKYIPVTRSYQREQDRLARRKIQDAQAAQALAHQARMDELSYRKEQADVKIREAQASRMSASVPVPAPPATV